MGESCMTHDKMENAFKIFLLNPLKERVWET
jgi:hypothetical protein